MNKKFSLLENEKIDFEIQKKMSFPFLVSDLLYLGMVLIFFVIFQSINFKTIDEISSQSILKLLPVFVLLCILLMCLKDFYKRYINVFKWKIILTNFRLIVVDSNKQLVKEFYLDAFPKLSYVENANSNGTLIIGENIRTKEFPNRGYESYSFDLYNILEIKKVVSLIELKIYKEHVYE